MECPRCHEPASPAALACGACAAPLCLGEEPRPALLDRVLDLDRRARGRVEVELEPAELAPLRGPLPTRGEGDRTAGGGREADRDSDLDLDLDPGADLTGLPETAPLGVRVAAGAVDGALVALGTAAPILLAAWALPDGVSLWRNLLPAALPLGALAFVAYAALGHGLLGATCGDRLMGLAVVDRDGQRPGMGRATARAALALLGTVALGAGTWLALFTFSPRALHDRAAGTFVVRAP